MEISLSTTGFNDAARCLKRYEYRWVDRLVLKPKDVRPAMRRGTWIHRALQLADEDQPWRDELDRMWAWAIENEVDPEAASLLRVEVGELVDDYLAYWAGHEDPPGPFETVETEYTVQWSPKPGICLTSKIDCIKRDRNGRLWIWERKSTERIPDSDWRGVDPQTMLQYIEARANGLDVVGVMFDYVVTEPGAKLRVTKEGRLYKGDEERSTRMRHWQPVEGELRLKGASEAYIAEMRSRVVSEAQWFQRYPVFRPDEQATLVLKDVAAVLRSINDARAKDYYPRALSILDCRMFCPYGKLCMHEMMLGRKSEAYREEYTTALSDEVYSEGRTAW